ncbi:septal ring lytic transglycosylase RlpA family protein [Ideonella sp. A 288]|uniref:septal ring lytic transglycosylase RlpA family protein n=1 Tax=Ideonella sp. A 288 TaxID=1962181 RepID=UPI000B4A784B|nr:septal ring lytic transglycosylase RlpA family protein [Ideonella sp. A 288]
MSTAHASSSTGASAARTAGRLLAWVVALGLAGCAGLRTPSAPGRDGPGASPPPNLAAVPDAVPRVDPVRAGGPNKPYEVFGQTYVPRLGDPPMRERGLASWYGRAFHGRPTANGETYDMYAMTAAHKTMPLPSYARVRNPANGREVVVRVNDRGPFHAGRVIDLSYTAALKLGLLNGVAPVELERLTHEAIRSGSWQRDAEPVAAAPPPPPVVLPLAPAPAPAAVPGPLPAVTPAADTGDADPIAALAQQVGAAPGLRPDAIPGRTHDTATAAPAGAPLAPGFWLQFGAFRDATSAEAWRQQLAQQVDWLAPRLSVVADAPWHRVQAGPWASRQDALFAADRLRDRLAAAPVLLERR